MSSFDYDMITRFLEGEMQPEERQAFLASMEGDAGLQREVELCRELRDSLQKDLFPDAREQALRATLRQAGAEFFQSAPRAGGKSADPTPPGSMPRESMSPGRMVPISRRTRWWAAAAAAVLAIFIWQPWKSDLVDRFADASMPPFAERGAADNRLHAVADSLLAAATRKFNSSHFSAALPDFERIENLEPENAFVQFYHSIALFQTGEVDRSRYQLERLYSGASLFKYDAAFFVALCYLKEKDKPSAIHWLRVIPAGATAYPKARTLLQKLQ